jgi:predicted nuclease of predicted toxin-antitoxin system
MKFLLDSCISFFAVKALRDAEFEVAWIPETGKDPGDEAIIEKAFQEKYVLVTADKDFGELVFFKKMGSPTIIRLVNIPAKRQGELLLRIIEKYRKEIENISIITADKYRNRIRPMKE